LGIEKARTGRTGLLLRAQCPLSGTWDDQLSPRRELRPLDRLDEPPERLDPALPRDEEPLREGVAREPPPLDRLGVERGGDGRLGVARGGAGRLGVDRVRGERLLGAAPSSSARRGGGV